MIPLWARIGIALTAVVILMTIAGPADIADLLSAAKPVYIVAYTTNVILVLALYGLQVWVLLKSAGFEMSLTKVLCCTLTSWSMGQITPARAGDFGLAVFLKPTVPAAVTVGIVMVDKVLSLSILTLFATMGLAALGFDSGGALKTSAAVVVVGFALVLVFSTRGNVRRLARLFGRLPGFRNLHEEGISDALGSIRSRRTLLLFVSAITVRWVLTFFANLMLFKAMNWSPAMPTVIAASSAGRLISLIPISIGGLGVKEPAQIVIYGLDGIPADVVITVSLVGLVIGLSLAIMIPILDSIRSAFSRRAR